VGWSDVVRDSVLGQGLQPGQCYVGAGEAGDAAWRCFSAGAVGGAACKVCATHMYFCVKCFGGL
jgi:hypothetical protein